MQVIATTHLRGNLKKYFDEVITVDDIIIVQRTTDDEAVVIMPIKEYNSIIESSYLFSSANNTKRLTDSVAQIKNKQNKKSKI